MTMMKQVTKAFDKKIYLLGQDKDGYNVYLEAPRWDCGWYWGFGYIETYTNKTRPETARDVFCHTHWDTSIVGQQSDKYVYHINESPIFEDTVLTDKESWELSDLMQSYYTLLKAAEFFRHGNSWISSSINSNELKNKELENKINQEILPIIFKRINEILTPQN